MNVLQRTLQLLFCLWGSGILFFGLLIIISGFVAGLAGSGVVPVGLGLSMWKAVIDDTRESGRAHKGGG